MPDIALEQDCNHCPGPLVEVDLGQWNQPEARQMEGFRC
jgi:hypothetical protein